MSDPIIDRFPIQRDGTSGEVLIQHATWRDVRSIYQLEKECFPQDAWPVWDIVAVLTLPNLVRLKAEYEGHLIGFVVGDIKYDQDLAWIATIGVADGFRSYGIGSRLLRVCEAELKVSRARLSVRVSNEDAIRLYRREGYQHIGVWFKYYKGDEDAMVMEKYLEESL